MKNINLTDLEGGAEKPFDASFALAKAYIEIGWPASEEWASKALRAAALACEACAQFAKLHGSGKASELAFERTLMLVEPIGGDGLIRGEASLDLGRGKWMVGQSFWADSPERIDVKAADASLRCLGQALPCLGEGMNVEVKSSLAGPWDRSCQDMSDLFAKAQSLGCAPVLRLFELSKEEWFWGAKRLELQKDLSLAVEACVESGLFPEIFKQSSFVLQGGWQGEPTILSSWTSQLNSQSGFVNNKAERGGARAHLYKPWELPSLSEGFEKIWKQLAAKSAQAMAKGFDLPYSKPASLDRQRLAVAIEAEKISQSARGALDVQGQSAKPRL